MSRVTRYIINDVFVQNVHESKYKAHVSGIGDNAVFTEQSNGWFVTLAGSYEALWIGFEKPDLKHGDLVRIIIERTTDAKPI